MAIFKSTNVARIFETVTNNFKYIIKICLEQTNQTKKVFYYHLQTFLWFYKPILFYFVL